MWLNSISAADAGFFGIEVHAVRIGDSPPAVRLDVVVEPDDWSRQVRATASSELSEGRARYVAWWAEFIPALQERFPGWSNATKPQPQGWMDFPSGRSGVTYGVNFSWPDGASGYRLRAGVYMADGATQFDQLARHRDAIDTAFGQALSWEPLEDAKASRVATYLEDTDPDDRGRWPEYREWALESLGRLRQACQQYIDGMD